jgi:serine/threonine-protein kinase
MAEELEPGARFGGYEILGELGAGGMGRVFRARDVALDRVVAIKVLAPELSRDAAFVQRFQREARAVASLSHPNIVQIFAVGSVDGVHFLTMEYLDGQSLGRYLKSAHWPEAEAILIARQVCQALRVAHAAGIVHRDVKPDNLILTRRGEVKLVDLGIAKRVDDDQSMTQSGSAVGTPHYIAPEQVQSRRDVDGRADIYSLGATLYHLATGHTPFEGSSGAHVMSMHLFTPLPDPRAFEPGLSDGLCRVLRKMMAKDREERYPDAHALDLDLYQLQIGRSPQPAEPREAAIAATLLGGGGGTAIPATPLPFDPAVIGRVERSLAHTVGPMARVLVRQAARSTDSLEELCRQLGGHVEAGAARETFLTRCRACGDATPATGLSPTLRAATPATSLPAQGLPGGTAAAIPALGEAVLLQAESELSRRIGPLAQLLVRRAARAASSRADLVARLESNIADEEDRRTFRRALLGVD